MNDKDFAKLTSEVEILIRNAASVDFDPRVDINMRIYAKEAMNALNLSKAWKNICSLCHVSTDYVARINLKNERISILEMNLLRKTEDDHSMDHDLFVDTWLKISPEKIE